MAVTEITHHAERLSALCELWQDERQEIWITLQGISMLPTLPPGTRLRLSCARSAPRIGDVVAFRREGGLIVHRIIAVVEGRGDVEAAYVCQGDGNDAPDPPVLLAEIVGVVRESQEPSPLERLRQTAWSLRRRPAVVRVVRSVRRLCPGARKP
jgi:hypothetical protein